MLCVLEHKVTTRSVHDGAWNGAVSLLTCSTNIRDGEMEMETDRDGQRDGDGDDDGDGVGDGDGDGDGDRDSTLATRCLWPAAWRRGVPGSSKDIALPT